MMGNRGVVWQTCLIISEIKWHLGLTHQFHCKECGAPIDEEIASRMWRWKCDFCGWKSECRHAPRIMKAQHRRVVALRKLIWRGE